MCQHLVHCEATLELDIITTLLTTLMNADMKVMGLVVGLSYIEMFFVCAKV